MNSITFDDNSKIRDIGDIDIGGVFHYEDDWYMLTNEISHGGQQTTAINLRTGMLRGFYCIDRVETFNGILHINCRQ